ncbi:MAG: hypothetical protein WC546_04350 [Candidatus Omnitrophota bacterium]
MNKKITHEKFKKTIKSFIKDEDGFVNKNKILKIGLGTVASVGILGSLSDAYAQNHCTLVVHTNSDMANPAVKVLTCSRVAGGCQSCTANHMDHSSSNVSGKITSWANVKGYWISGEANLDGAGCPETFR